MLVVSAWWNRYSSHFFALLHKQSAMKIACCQFAPVFGKRDESFKKARDLLKKAGHDSFDLVMFPEMAFVGYMFENKPEVEPFLENEKGPTFEFCKEIAKEYSSFVAAGYPRLFTDGDVKKYYNSMCFVSPSGELLATYDKSFLYETDHNWANEGSGFMTIDIPQWKKKVGLGICMDINPYEYKDSSLYEFANYHKENKTDLILFCANWLDSDLDEVRSAHSTHQYWANRLRPLLHSKVDFVACNRVGTEKGETFCGGSCVLSLQQPAIRAALTKKSEGVLVQII